MQESACSYGLCDGDGWIVDEDTNTGRRCKCLEERVRRYRRFSALQPVPPRYRDVAFDRNPIAGLPPGVLLELRRYIGTLDEELAECNGLWLGGPQRIGKTSAAALIVKHAADDHQVALWPVVKLLAKIRDTFRADSPISTWDLQEQLVELELLVLDDLAAANATPWVKETLYAIVNERFNEKRAIIITTDQPVSALCEQFDSRTINRLLEICGRPIEIAAAEPLRAVR